MARETSTKFTLHEELLPTAKRLGDLIAEVRGPRDGVVSLSLGGQGGDDLFWYTGGEREVRRGKPPEGVVHVLRVKGSVAKVRKALASARSPGELLAISGLEVRGDVTFANRLVPSLMRLLAEVQAKAKARA